MGKLKYLVIHCTATPEGREVSGAEIRAWHTNPVSKGGRGWKQVGYTDLFHLNGGVERLVNNNEDANVDPWEATNAAPISSMPVGVQRMVKRLRTPVPPGRKRRLRST